MGSVPIRLRVRAGGDLRLVVPRRAAERLEIEPGEYEVRFGDRRAPARVSIALQSAAVLTCGLARRLGLGAERRLRLVKEGGALRIGPLIGILGRRRPGPALYGEQTNLFRRFIRTARRHHCAAYVFDPRRRSDRPLPDVVFNRYDARSRSAVWRWMQAHPQLPLFNRPFEGKWEMHSALAGDPALEPHLPETHPAGEETVWSMLRRHGFIFLKPANGLQGRGILRLRRIGRLVGVKASQGGPERPLSPEQAGRIVQRRISSASHLVQEGIPAARIGGGATDIRVLVQKDGDGRWRYTGAAARVGRIRGIASNLHRGGRVMPLNAALRRMLRRQADRAEVAQRIRDVALACARRLDAQCGSVGELGVDVAVCPDGRVYIFEANIRPGREAFFRLGPAGGTFRRAIDRPIRYAAYLAGFGSSPAHDWPEEPGEAALELEEPGGKGGAGGREGDGGHLAEGQRPAGGAAISEASSVGPLEKVGESDAEASAGDRRACAG